MPRLSQKVKDEMQFFINSKTHKRQYNLRCQHCTSDCKQSYQAQIVCCPKFCKSPCASVEISSVQGGKA